MVQLTKKRKMTKSKISSKSKKKFNKSRKNGMTTNKLIRDGGGFKSLFRKQQKAMVSPKPRNLQSGQNFAAQRRAAVTAQISSMRTKAPTNREGVPSIQATPLQRQAVIWQLPSSRR